MDWCETVVPLIMHNLDWGPAHKDDQSLFEAMWGRLRQLVLHYLRGNNTRLKDLRTLDIGAVGREYARLAEQVSTLASTQQSDVHTSCIACMK